MNGLSIIIPEQNEALSLADLLPRIRGIFPQAEIVVVDGGSSDTTVKTSATHRVR